MNIPQWPGWHLIGQFPEGDPDGVGSWLLHHGGEALLLEVPPGLTIAAVRKALARTGAKLKYVAVSHDHEDHLDPDAWEAITSRFQGALPLHSRVLQGFEAREHRALLGGEPLWLVKAPKHSMTDHVAVFRGVAMTGDIELGTLDSVNGEVPLQTKKQSMRWLEGFSDRRGYQVHSIVSAHLNDVRTDIDWGSLFSFEPVHVG